MLKIFHAPRARSMRVLWLCEEMGVPYETAPASFFNPSEEFSAANPLRTIPALVDGEVVMIESIAIMLYIMGKHGPTDLALQPDDPNYAAYLQYLLFGEAGMAAMANAMIATRYAAPDDSKQNWTNDYLSKTLYKRFKLIGERLAQTPYIAGERFTAADISVGYVIGMADFVGLGDRVPKAALDYRARLSERPAFQRAAAVE